MKRVLNVSVCQTDVLWEDPDGNRMRLERLVNGHMRSLRAGILHNRFYFQCEVC